MRMTDIGISRLKPKAKRYEVWEDGRTGFGVRVSVSGRKTFVYMYWRDGKARRMTLGVYVYRTRFLGHKFVSCGGPE